MLAERLDSSTQSERGGSAHRIASRTGDRTFDAEGYQSLTCSTARLPSRDTVGELTRPYDAPSGRRLSRSSACELGGSASYGGDHDEAACARERVRGFVAVFENR